MKKYTKITLATLGIVAAASTQASLDSKSKSEQGTSLGNLSNAESVFQKLMREGEKKPKSKKTKFAAKKKSGNNKKGRKDPNGEPKEEASEKEQL